jgi:hypothetical protein
MDPGDVEEMDLKWTMAMTALRSKNLFRGKGLFKFNKDTKVGFDKRKVRCYNCNLSGHFARSARHLRVLAISQAATTRRTPATTVLIIKSPVPTLLRLLHEALLLLKQPNQQL